MSKHDKSDKAAVSVRDNDVDRAMKKLKRNLQKEGVFREMRTRAHFTSAGEKKREQEKNNKTRWNKQRRKEEQRDGQPLKPYWGIKSPR